MNKDLKYFLFIVLLFSVSANCIGQKKYRKRAKDAITKLKDGYLIISIPTYQKEIDTLTNLLEKTVDKEDKEWLTAKLQKAEKKRNEVPNLIQEGFGKYYDFSKVLFVYDTSLTHLRKGVFTNVFINESYANLDNEFFFINKRGFLPSSNRIRNVTLDKNFRTLESPFPYLFYDPYETHEIKLKPKIFFIPLIRVRDNRPIEYRFAEGLNLLFWEYYKKVTRKKWFFKRNGD